MNTMWEAAGHGVHTNKRKPGQSAMSLFQRKKPSGPLVTSMMAFKLLSMASVSPPKEPALTAQALPQSISALPGLCFLYSSLTKR